MDVSISPSCLCTLLISILGIALFENGNKIKLISFLKTNWTIFLGASLVWQAVLQYCELKVMNKVTALNKVYNSWQNITKYDS